MTEYRNIFDKEALTYEAYRKLVDDLLEAGKTTGEDHSEAMLHYSKMNVQRMNRVEKTAILNEELTEALAQLKGAYDLLVITEGWCGDAAQIVPVIYKMTQASGGKLSLRLVLRDQNLPLIDAHLTNGGRAIPVLLILDKEGNLMLPKWGPRPVALQELMEEWKKEGVVMPELAEKLHGWYAKDKTQHTQKELIALIKQLP